MRSHISTLQTKSALSPMQRYGKLALIVTTSILVIGGVATFSEFWLADVLGDHFIATILLLIVSVVVITLLLPLFSNTKRQ